MNLAAICNLQRFKRQARHSSNAALFHVVVNHVDHHISGFSCSRSTSAAQRLSVSPQLVCAVVVYLRTGPDRYQAYSLEGGP